MRSFLAFSVFISLCATANAATVHHSREHVIVQSGQIEGLPLSAYGAPRPSVDYDDAPTYNDPSKYGGGTALPVMP